MKVVIKDTNLYQKEFAELTEYFQKALVSLKNHPNTTNPNESILAANGFTINDFPSGKYTQVTVTEDEFEDDESDTIYYKRTLNGGFEEADEFLESETYYTYDETALNTDFTIESLDDYYTYIKAIALLENGRFLMIPFDEEPFKIDLDTRKITAPDMYQTNGISIIGDHKAEMLCFKVNRFSDYMDLYNTNISIKWKFLGTGAVRQGISSAVCAHVLKNEDTQEDFLRFGWLIEKGVTEQSGKLEFSISFTHHSANADESFDLNTQSCVGVIKDSVIVDLESAVIDAETDSSKRFNFLESSKIYNEAFANVILKEGPDTYLNIYDAAEENDKYGKIIVEGYCATLNAGLRYRWKHGNNTFAAGSGEIAQSASSGVVTGTAQDHMAFYSKDDTDYQHLVFDQIKYKDGTIQDVNFLKQETTNAEQANLTTGEAKPASGPFICKNIVDFVKYHQAHSSESITGAYEITITPTLKEKTGRPYQYNFKILEPLSVDTDKCNVEFFNLLKHNGTTIDTNIQDTTWYIGTKAEGTITYRLKPNGDYQLGENEHYFYTSSIDVQNNLFYDNATHTTKIFFNEANNALVAKITINSLTKENNAKLEEIKYSVDSVKADGNTLNKNTFFGKFKYQVGSNFINSTEGKNVLALVIPPKVPENLNIDTPVSKTATITHTKNYATAPVQTLGTYKFYLNPSDFTTTTFENAKSLSVEPVIYDLKTKTIANDFVPVYDINATVTDGGTTKPRYYFGLRETRDLNQAGAVSYAVHLVAKDGVGKIIKKKTINFDSGWSVLISPSTVNVNKLYPLYNLSDLFEVDPDTNKKDIFVSYNFVVDYKTRLTYSDNSTARDTGWIGYNSQTAKNLTDDIAETEFMASTGSNPKAFTLKMINEEVD